MTTTPPRLLTLFVTFFLVLSGFADASPKADGYRGIWFTLGQKSEHGDKYSGGLGTYTANHVPVAIYSAKADKTFFVYGGTVRDKRQLLIMASYFDHATGKAPRPTIVHDKGPVNDPHDNGAIAIDGDGFVWVFVSGRARTRPGFIYKSTQSYSVDDFEKVDQREMTYPQPRFLSGGGGEGAGRAPGFFYLFTKYTAGRELYWQTSPDGRAWEPEQKLAGFGGHYQVSGVSPDGATIGSAFMYHPNGNVDARTNLYYVRTRDFGRMWTAADGRPIRTPLDSPANDALLIDYKAQGLNVYIHDLHMDADGYPAILYLTSRGAKPGPENGPRVWRVTSYDGLSWRTSDVCESDHNYDTGCLFRDGRRWTVVGPTLPGPQPWGTGGEIAVWSSEDGGRTWRQTRQVTSGSRFNHSYVRRVVDGRAPFQLLWADGNPDELGESRLYFGSPTSEKYFELPYDMTGDWEEPTQR